MDDTEDFAEFKHLWVEPVVLEFTEKFQKRIEKVHQIVKANHRNYPFPVPYFWQCKASIDI